MDDSMHAARALLVCGLALACLSGLVIAETAYDVSIDGSDDVPDRTVEIEGENFTIDAVAQVSPGTDITVSVDAPSNDSEYDVELRNHQRYVVMSRNTRTGDETVTFPSDCPDCDPGSYMVAVYEDGVLMAVHPVVIAGYDVTLSVPGTASEGETVTAEIDVQPTTVTGQPESVEVVLGNGGEDRRVEATHDAGTSYSAEMDLGGLDPGAYLVYAGALGNESINGSDEPNVLAISSSRTLEIESDSGSGGGGGGGGVGGGETTETATPTVTPTTTATDEGGEGEATPTRTPTVTEPDTETPTETEDGVITPNDGTETATATEDDGAGPSEPLLLASLLAFGLWTQRRRP